MCTFMVANYCLWPFTDCLFYMFSIEIAGKQENINHYDMEKEASISFMCYIGHFPELVTYSCAQYICVRGLYR